MAGHDRSDKAVITGCILARNEEHRIADALASMVSWTDQLIVIDNESEDDTVSVARRYTDAILSAPRASNFDAARNLAVDHARGDWLFYLDADERVPERLGLALRHLVEERGDQFDALQIPFKHYFCGKWMEHSGWWPGYTRPQLLKKGSFRYNERLHSGVHVVGRTASFPADDPDLAIVHYSYDDLDHYLDKLNRYTDGEAESLWEDGQRHSWQSALAHFVLDWQLYYERGRADLDGMHGFVLAFMSGFYRFAARAKLWDLRRGAGQLPREERVPPSVIACLDFMQEIAARGAAEWLAPDNFGRPRHIKTVPREWLTDGPNGGPVVEVNGPAADGAPRISACLLVRNEKDRIEGTIRSLSTVADEILVIDNESTDGTAELATALGAKVVTAPRSRYSLHFDGARNLATDHTTGDWILFIDADELVPDGLGGALRRLVRERGDSFDGICLPFRNEFYGRWMRGGAWWPGYKGPQLVRRGRFTCGDRLHSGVQVHGRVMQFPAGDPELAVRHEAYRSVREYLEKLNRYTRGEAEYLDQAGESHNWTAMLGQFAADWHRHYDVLGGREDGMHGFVHSFLCGFYRFASRAKLWDLRRLRGEDGRDGQPLPANLAEMLGFMRSVIGHAGPRAAPTAECPAASAGSRAGAVAAQGEGQPITDLLWNGPLMDPSGYAEDGRNLVLALVEAGEDVRLVPAAWGPRDAAVSPEERAALLARAAPANTRCRVRVHNTLPRLLDRSGSADYHVARTVFETDRLFEGWAQILNGFDRVWVPSNHNRDLFVASGVEAERVAVIPECLDVERFAAAGPIPLPGEEGFRFLAVFDWMLHKGWDVLLPAFARAFGASAGVGLVVKTWSSNGYTPGDIEAMADGCLREYLGKPLSAFPNIHLWQQDIPSADVPRLYASCDCFVLPTRGEAWCRPLMEAMAAGIPTIATAWSGHTDYHDAKVGYPLRYHLEEVSDHGAREVPFYRGHRWAAPDAEHLVRLLRFVVSNRDAAERKAVRGQARIAERFSRASVAPCLQAELAGCRAAAARRAGAAPPSIQPDFAAGRAASVGPSDSAGAAPAGVPGAAGSPARLPPANPLPRDPVPPTDFRRLLGRPIRIRWEGDLLVLSSLAHVNRELCAELMSYDDVELSISALDRAAARGIPLDERIFPSSRFGKLLARFDAELSGPPDVTVRHHFPPRWDRPSEGALVVMQPWELSHLPGTDWAESAVQDADEVWAYSRFVRDCYVRSGVPAERVPVVPLGVRTDIFRPDGPRLRLPTTAPVRFLFVGGTIPRKGADVLLDAYVRAFTRTDGVCLIVKDMCTRSFYRGQHMGETIRRLQGQPATPQIVYIDDDLDEGGMAALYRSCTALVQPYRGEGFCLPALEALACGRPVAVTAGGPTDDFVDDTVALRIPAHRRTLPGRYSGPRAFPVDPWELDPDVTALAHALRWAYDNPGELGSRDRATRARVLEGWTWGRAVEVARLRLGTLACPERQATGSAPPTGSPRRASGPHGVGQTSRRRKPSVSLCMIARDEEERIGAGLSSAAPFVDEIVVVDTGSKDATRQVAAAHGARVLDFPWAESFSEARNHSLDAANGDWIFWMDADDVLPPHCGEGLRSVVAGRSRPDAAFQMHVRIPPAEGAYGDSVVDHIKLFPRRDDLRFEFRIHEQIIPAIRRAGLPIEFTELYVVHQHYDRSPSGQARKRARDFRLLDLDLRERPDHPFVLFNLGMTYLYGTRDCEAAAHYLERSIRGSDWQDSIVRKAYALLSTSYLYRDDVARALITNERGRDHYPDDAELLFQAGQLYQIAGDLDKARQSLERLTAGEERGHYRSVDAGLRSFRAQHEMAQLHRRSGDLAACECALRRLMAEHPNYPIPWADLVELLSATGRRREAAIFWNGRPGSKNHQGLYAGVRPSTSAQAVGSSPTDGQETLIDCMARTRIYRPAEVPQAVRCIATVCSGGYHALLEGFLESLTRRGGCHGCLIVVLVVDGDDACYEVISRFAEDGVVPIRCDSLAHRNPTVKAAMYSIAAVVQADAYLCLDLDMLVLADLSTVFDRVEQGPPNTIYACRDAGLAGPTLMEELRGFYAGDAEDLAFLLGSQVEAEVTAAASYDLIVNDGLFAGSRQALERLDTCVRSLMPQSVAWVDAYEGHGCRNQFVFNLALAVLGCGSILDDRFNLQLHVREVKQTAVGCQIGATWEGNPVSALHFCGPARGQYQSWRSKLQPHKPDERYDDLDGSSAEVANSAPTGAEIAVSGAEPPVDSAARRHLRKRKRHVP